MSTLLPTLFLYSCYLSMAMDAVLPGLAFGAALAASGVYKPQIIISQLTLDDWHMLRTFLTATATTSLLVALAQKLHHRNVDVSPRKPSNLGLLGQFDGNYIGGLLLGAGLALTGSCPGTVFAQVALGYRTGQYALLGGCVSGIVWTGMLKPFLTQRSSSSSSSPSSSMGQSNGTGKSVTAHSSLHAKCNNSEFSWQRALHISPDRMLVVAEAAYVIVIYGTGLLTEGNSGYAVSSGVVGGLAIGVAQLLSLASRGSLIGVSGCYREIGDWVWWFAGGDSRGACPSVGSVSFTLALMAGAKALHTLAPAAVLASSTSQPVEFQTPPLVSFVGGAAMALGALMAGGCTSGHGISGMSAFSTASLITIGTMFGAGVLVARNLHCMV